MKFIFCILFVLGCASAQFSAAIEEVMLSIHNEIRSSIAKGKYRIDGTKIGAASNMRKMVCGEFKMSEKIETQKWDPSLATSAQKVADNCTEGPSGTPLVEENIYYGQNEYSYTLDSMVRVMVIWMDALKHYKGFSVRMYEATFKSEISNIYEEGNACSSCPTGYTCETTSGLCVS